MTNLKRYLTLQVKEIREHAYYMSLNLGRRVDLNEATIDWVKKPLPHYENKPHAVRFNDTYGKHESELEELCGNYCRDGCKGIEQCPMADKYLHKLLED